MSKLPEKKVPEFSHLIDISNIEDSPVGVTVNVDEQSCKELKDRFDVMSVDQLSADLKIERKKGYCFYVSGKINAKITQECIVTLEPVISEIKDDFDAWYAEKSDAVSFAKAKHSKIMENQDPEVPFLEEEDDPEPVINGKIDVGELIVQYVSLSINPYPRKDGARHVLGDDEMNPEKRSDNPFAELESMKRILKDKDE